MTYEVYEHNNTFILRNFLNTISLGKIWAFSSNNKKQKQKQKKKEPTHSLKLIWDDELYKNAK